MTDAPTRHEAETDERELAREIAEITAQLGTDEWVWVEGPGGELTPTPAVVIYFDPAPRPRGELLDFGPDFDGDPF